MASIASIQHLLGNTSIFDLTVSAVVVGLIAYVYSTISTKKPLAAFPVIALTEKGLDAKHSWFQHSAEVISKGLRETNGGIFQISHPSLSLHEATKEFWFMDYPGFEPMVQPLHDEPLLAEVIRGKLTQSMALMVDDLVEGVTTLTGDTFGKPADWSMVPLKADLRDVVARISSRAFLGKTLCRNKEWLQIAKDYAVDTFMAAQRLRMLPPFIRPIAHRVVPVCRRIQTQYRDARRIITPEVVRRVARTRQLLAEGKKSDKTADMIGWMVETAMKPGGVGMDFDFAAAQLLLSVAGIHNTTELLTYAILDICSHPYLYKLRLLDSFLKESHRFHPQGIANMFRRVTSDIRLENATILPAGSTVMFETVYDNPQVYEHPEKFDGARFLKLRDAGKQESKWQLVSTSKEHTGFGNGKYACPGRFLAAAELKIALAHLIMKYDWRHDPAGPPVSIRHEEINLSLPGLKAMCRRREPEIDLDVYLKDEA
ncbi:cytochrome P450 [Teratosphaeria nubilosa]|uniref:Cytochrome P450 n=1 Tax=Teratosphaeria nubilosa TaxID=161662 RepID=A0A6G1KY05_9PEZI|nr:cytochrome P450 [Teratosphaeria nubilosa]